MSQRERKSKLLRENQVREPTSAFSGESSECKRMVSLKGHAKVHGEKGILGKKCPETIPIIRKDPGSRLCCPLGIWIFFLSFPFSFLMDTLLN